VTLLRASLEKVLEKKTSTRIISVEQVYSTAIVHGKRQLILPARGYLTVYVAVWVVLLLAVYRNSYFRKPDNQLLYVVTDIPCPPRLVRPHENDHAPLT
jgi:hypothetical protein